MSVLFEAEIILRVAVHVSELQFYNQPPSDINVIIEIFQIAAATPQLT